MSDTPAPNPHETQSSAIHRLSHIAQISILSAIIATLLLSPAVIYYFTAHFESKLPVCSEAQPASATWRCKIDPPDQANKVQVAGGNPAYCPEGKQHFAGRAWCNFNWDRPINPAP